MGNCTFVPFDFQNRPHREAYRDYEGTGHPWVILGDTLYDMEEAFLELARDRLRIRFPRSNSIPTEEESNGDERLALADLNKQDMQHAVYFDSAKFEEVLLWAPGDSYEIVFVCTKSGAAFNVVCPRFPDPTKIKMSGYTREGEEHTCF